MAAGDRQAYGYGELIFDVAPPTGQRYERGMQGRMGESGSGFELEHPDRGGSVLQAVEQCFQGSGVASPRKRDQCFTPGIVVRVVQTRGQGVSYAGRVSIDLPQAEDRPVADLRIVSAAQDDKGVDGAISQLVLLGNTSGQSAGEGKSDVRVRVGHGHLRQEDDGGRRGPRVPERVDRPLDHEGITLARGQDRFESAHRGGHCISPTQLACAP